MPYLTTSRFSCTLGAVLAALTLLAGPAAAQTIRLGIMGDSNSDEYRAEDNHGGAYAATTFNWAEVLIRLRDVDIGQWGTRSEPRRSGYEFNWARSGAKAADLAAQQGGLAEQIRQGRVEYVIIHIGTNDFHPNGDYGDIYNGRLSGAALQQKINGILTGIRGAIDAVVNAGAKVIVTGIPDAGLHPVFHALYPDAAKRQRVTNAIEAVNSALRSDAAGNPKVGFSDMADLFAEFGARTNAQGFAMVGNEAIDVANAGNEPHHLRLGDSAGHLGTVGSSLMANALFIAPLNREFDTGIAPLTDGEILCIAGIKVAANCASRPKSPTALIAR